MHTSRLNPHLSVPTAAVNVDSACMSFSSILFFDRVSLSANYSASPAAQHTTRPEHHSSFLITTQMRMNLLSQSRSPAQTPKPASLCTLNPRHPLHDLRATVRVWTLGPLSGVIMLGQPMTALAEPPPWKSADRKIAQTTSHQGHQPSKQPAQRMSVIQAARSRI